MGIVTAIMTSQVLSEKIGVVFGVANKRSIAWAIAKAWAAAGARLIFNYQGERIKENVAELVGEFGENVPLYPCDVSSDEEIAKFFQEVRGQTDRLDLLLHSVAFAPKPRKCSRQRIKSWRRSDVCLSNVLPRTRSAFMAIFILDRHFIPDAILFS